MNTYDIIYFLKDEKCFKGVYPINKLPRKKITERPIGLILNLDYSNEPGSYWVALFINEKNEAFYFDSYGFPNFNEYLLKFFNLNEVKYIYFNKFQAQSNNSKTCGTFCILFIKMLCNSYSLSDFLKLFSNNRYQNDLISIRILEN